MGQDSIRGIFVNHWRSCYKWPGGNLTYSIDYYFSGNHIHKSPMKVKFRLIVFCFDFVLCMFEIYFIYKFYFFLIYVFVFFAYLTWLKLPVDGAWNTSSSFVSVPVRAEVMGPGRAGPIHHVYDFFNFMPSLPDDVTSVFEVSKD